ncbi:MAG: CD225/dispanin family protein [Tannerella sp.]|jgi:hypothetical protein|nr:CD225/dispanin family protein [Tannerella sp.]
MSTSVEPRDNYQKNEKPYQADVTNAFNSPVNGPSNGGMVRPKSYQTEAIIVTLVSMLCCGSVISLIIGIIAIVKANKVDSYFYEGNIHEAIQNSESAKKLTIWAGVIAIIWFILGIALYFTLIATIISTTGGLEQFGL